MNQSPITRSSLLMAIRDRRDQRAWREFVDIYAPLIHAHGRGRGLQDADAADLAQDVLGSVLGACQRFEYDPRRGSFRGWLFTMTRNRLFNWFAAEERRDPAGGGTAAEKNLDDQPSRESLEELWNRQHKERLFAWAAEQVRASFEDATWQAFWQTAVEQHTAQDVAQRLNLSVGAVYVARSRVLARLREKIQTVEAEER